MWLIDFTCFMTPTPLCELLIAEEWFRFNNVRDNSLYWFNDKSHNSLYDKVYRSYKQARAKQAISGSKGLCMCKYSKEIRNVIDVLVGVARTPAK